jgi:uncharacterized membrane protein
MTHAQREVRIDRPIEEVFDFLADGTNNPDWQHLVIGKDDSAQPVGLGCEFHQRARHPLGFTVSADYRITAFERPRRLALVATSGGPIRPTVSYELSQVSSAATTVRCTVQYHPTGLARLASPVLFLLHPLFAWETSSLKRARALLERQPLRPSAAGGVTGSG